MPARRLVGEMMDSPAADRAELARSLGDLRHANRWLGGTRLALGALRRAVRRVSERPVRVVDVGTGSADLPIAFARWCMRNGIAAEIVAADVHPGTARLALEHAAGHPEVHVIQADGLALPMPDGAVHIALCATALHHFDDATAVRSLRELARVSRVGVVVSDLRRSVISVAAIDALAATVWRTHPITRHDGPASARAGFTPAEMRSMAASAGMRNARIDAGPFRLLLQYSKREAR